MPDAPEERVAADPRGGGAHVARACLVLWLSAAALSCPAGAQDRAATLVVRAAPADAERAASLAERIVLGALEGWPRVSPAPAPAPARGPETGWLTRAIAEADERFAHFGLAEAATPLDGAIARLDASGAAGTSAEELAQLFLLRARIAEASGDASAADADAAEALAVSPSLVVDPALHPPSIAERVERARAAGATCRIALEIDPAGARASIDGAPAGPVPTELPCGRHWLTLSAPAHLERALALEARPHAEPQRIALELDPGAALREAGEPFGPLGPLAVEGAAALGREIVVLDVATAGDQLVVRLGEVEVRAGRRATDDDVLALLRAARTPAPGPDPAVVAGASIGAAVAVAALVTTLVIVLSPSAPDAFQLEGRFLP